MARQFEALPPRPRTRSLMQLALIVGVVGLVLSLVAYFITAREEFWRAYLFGYLFWFSIAIGCLAVQLIHHVAGGNWAAAILRFLEAGHSTFPLLAVFFLPLLLNVVLRQSVPYIWNDDNFVAGNHIMQHRSVYYNWWFWSIRAVLYFAFWILVSWRLRKWTAERDQGKPEITGILRGISGPALVALAVTGTGASYDWLMSLEPLWYSSIYGLIFLMACLISGAALTILVAYLASRDEPLKGTLVPGRWNDLGSLLLAFIMLWAYMSFSQFLLIWYGNLSEEVPWYLRRLSGGWMYVALGMVLFHFMLPFVVLIFRPVKRSGRVLAAVAGFVLLVRFIQLLFEVGPAGTAGLPIINWTHLVIPLAVGGFWLYFYLRRLGSQPLLPVGDPKLEQPANPDAHGVQRQQRSAT